MIANIPCYPEHSLHWPMSRISVGVILLLEYGPRTERKNYYYWLILLLKFIFFITIIVDFFPLRQNLDSSKMRTLFPILTSGFSKSHVSPTIRWRWSIKVSISSFLLRQDYATQKHSFRSFRQIFDSPKVAKLLSKLTFLDIQTLISSTLLSSFLLQISQSTAFCLQKANQ